VNDSRIKFIRNCHWEEVFLLWYKNEGENPDWIKLAQDKGYASWADWRLNEHVKRFDCVNKQWALYETSNPSQVVVKWSGGPFSTWVERYYDGQQSRKFSELAQREDIQSINKIKRLIGDYPKDSVITAIEKEGGEMIVIEGMHRCCALALMAQRDLPFSDKLIFAIGK